MKMKGCSESMLSRYGVNSKLQISRNVTALRFLPKYTDRPAFCHNVMKLTRKMFNFAVEKDILEHTPFAEVKVPVELSSRERVLTDAEITKLWATELPKIRISLLQRSLRSERPFSKTRQKSNSVQNVVCLRGKSHFLSQLEHFHWRRYCC